MKFKKMRSFGALLALRLAAFSIGSGGAVFCLFVQKNGGLALLFALAAAWSGWSIWHLATDTNRRLARFFEAVRYSDFAIRFSKNEEKGATFEAVSRELNEVLESFRQTRAEKEANLVFLNALVQQLSAGILAFDHRQNLLLSNSAAFQFLGIYRLQNVADLPENHADLRHFIEKLTKKDKLVYRPQPDRELMALGSALQLQGRSVKLVALQNIRPELEQKESEAWRSLARVLRHEIMNSITPIVSLVETMQTIVQKDLRRAVFSDEKSKNAVADLDEALAVVAARSRGLVGFVEAYRHFTTVPPPKMAEIEAKILLERIAQLAAADMKSASVFLKIDCEPSDLKIVGDSAQLEMVLLNLLKNAREALAEKPSNEPRAIELSAGRDPRGRPFLAVEDNGSGVSSELLEEIFIPFFTTKNEGTGVGLSVSRQIAQLHGGSLSVEKGKLGGARLVLAF